MMVWWLFSIAWQMTMHSSPPPDPKPVKVAEQKETPSPTPTPKPDPPEPISSPWRGLAQCESGRVWDTNTGNGFYGGLQFHPETWLAFGGAKYAKRADLASRAEQIDIAEKVQAAQGWKAWPACSRQLGLR